MRLVARDGRLSNCEHVGYLPQAGEPSTNSECRARRLLRAIGLSSRVFGLQSSSSPSSEGKTALAEQSFGAVSLGTLSQVKGGPMLAFKIVALWVLLSLLGPSSCQGDRLNGSTVVSTMR